MIAAPPPAYHQEISIDDARLRPQGAGADSQLVDVTLRAAITQMTTSFERLLSFSDDSDVYVAPGLKSVSTKRMRIIHRGPIQPTPVDEDFQS